MIRRIHLEERVRVALARSRAVVLTGPRQCGKTTLARRFVPLDHARYFDLEDPLALARLSEPMSVLGSFRELVVVDEVQRAPDLFPVLRVLIDRRGDCGQYLLLGSASPRLLRQASESLLGRVEVIEMSGFGLDEVSPRNADTLWSRGGYPLSYLAGSDADSMQWRRQAIQRFVESDLPLLGLGAPPPAVLRFWTMLAHFHGQVWNAADPARSLGVSESTVRRYLDWLTQTYMVRQLQPWHANLSKRQVKSPKIYFRDTGFLHALMGVPDMQALRVHPRSGASWEGFALEEVLRAAAPDEAYFWATHGGAELDLLMHKAGQRVGVEFKYADAPRLTPSMRTALQDLALDALYVVYPGVHRYELADRVEAIPFGEIVAPAGETR